jgi:flavin reductase (DIM6/NTAB) family NADH-FMN oxidoreductase RutF
VARVGIDAKQFRSVLSQWASGVAIVTSRHAERVQGMTVSAFSSVSLVPPLVLVCAERTSITNRVIQDSKVLSVSVLAAGQEALSRRFSSKKDEHSRFQGLDCASGSTGCPRIPGALAWLDCHVVQAVVAGDHVVYIAEVESAELCGGRPLLHFRSNYVELA